jgi:nitrogen fixation/metabolism regulation signal transduction histidine kinase
MGENSTESGSTLDAFRRAAAKMAESGTTSDKINSLNGALESFSHEADRLTGAYNSLKDEFTLIHRELEETNHRLMRKVAELDILTAYLESILSNISQGILFIDLNGDVTTYNVVAMKMMGIDSDKVLYSSFWHYFSDNYFGFSMREALGSKLPPPLTHTTVKGPGGEDKVFEVMTTFVSEDEKPGKGYYQEITVKKMEGIIVMVRDITEIRQLQMLAARNDRLKELGEMAALVAHEIRNPLGGIKGFASLLRRDVSDKPQLAKMADYIIQGTDTLNRLVTDILNYARPMNPQFEKTDMRAMMGEMKEIFEADPSLRKGIDFVVEVPNEKVYAAVDATLLKSALLNLLVNARHAIAEKGILTLGLQTKGRDILIRVTDTGTGISDEDLPKLFTPFFHDEKGGIGVWTCRSAQSD